MYKVFIILALLLLGSLSAQAQEKKNVITTTFEVSGVCEMCTSRIEKTMDVKGIKAAEYDLETQLLTVSYATKFLSEDDLHALLNGIGHDTEKSKATEEQYNALHHCCKYRADGDH